jgi:glycosyltransferase involved in cell wall biosynthesis
VVANGPGDGASDVLRWYRREAPHPLTVVEESKPGLGRARNRGWRAAPGELIAFTDDDCYPAEDYLDRILTASRTGPLRFLGVGCCCSIRPIFRSPFRSLIDGSKSSRGRSFRRGSSSAPEVGVHQPE